MSNIFWLSVQFCIIIFISMFWYKLLNWSPELSIGMTIVTGTTLIFVTGLLFSDTRIALYIEYALAVTGIVLFALGGKFKGITNREESLLRRKFFSPGVVALFFIFIYGIIAFTGIKLYNWDELHQWGKSAVYLINNNQLPYGDLFDGENLLLSSTTFFHYLLCKLPRTVTGGIVEGNLYVSNLVLWFAGSLLPLSGMGWKEWKKCFGYNAIVFLAMHLLFVQPYYNIYCDQAVAMWAGGLIAWNILCLYKEKNTGIFTVLAMCNIALMKNMVGPLFVLVIVLAMFIKYCLTFECTIKELPKHIFQDLCVKKGCFAAACLASAFLLTALWSITVGDNALIRGDGIIKMQDDRFQLTLQSGLGKLFEPVNLSYTVPNLTFFIYFIFVIVILFVLSRYYFKGLMRRQYNVLLGFYLFGFFAFFVLMIYTYLTTFSYEDSIVTGSLNRYFSDYMMLGLLPLLAPFCRKFDGCHVCVTSRTTRIVVSVTLLIVLASSTTNGFASKVSGIELNENGTYQERLKFDAYKEIVDGYTGGEGKIYMINQDSNGYFTVLADYLFENQIDRSGMCYYFTADDMSIAGLEQYPLQYLPQDLEENYEYLWIYKTDTYFSSNAKRLLRIKPITNGDFYKVTNDDGRLKLEYLTNLNEVIADAEEN